MRIRNIQVRNFWMLSDISVDLEDDITFIVGRNNTGKTSLLEIIQMLTSKDDLLSFEDFSQSSYILFKELNAEFEKISAVTTEEGKETIELLKNHGFYQDLY